ncbi:SpoIID/LytB domain-containing protein [Pseudoflavonifractor sp. DSM 107456]|uniref:SpoIID/LytB domain-containing protein n=1 Tax=Pseudoflavonifractor gallinarum TaxID=2779352 RepID=A0ABR9R952_9FIRM|nr:SpoIID/LytB domain-containing protein [Pseudoflavonifractor gallinarum]MBE5055224.1 SpoIID/LytB domain-containing protein [Pseudoflavonifractor gallinarum]
MKGKWIKWTALCLAVALSASGLPARAAPAEETILRIGLYYGSNAMPSANLENSVGSGYRLGYFDDANQFVELGRTSKTKLSMLKTKTLYLSGGTYQTTPSSGAQTIGGYSLQWPGTYSDFTSAQTAAASVSGGFPAWVEGTYQVRSGAYATQAEAEAAALGTTAQVVQTSSSGINVVETGTAQILFQFDGGSSYVFGVMPDITGVSQPVTWFKGYKYYGGFRYERVGGDNITVVNLIGMEDYINCVISQEMSDSWPLEALKAQACAARTYAMRKPNSSKHAADHFDLCNGTHCQAYPGMKLTGSNTLRATQETAGMVIRYNGALIDAVYSSSDGGATENSENVWNDALPYLRGKADPYEATISSQIPNYNWSVTYTADELTQKLRSSGRSCDQIVDFRVSETTPTGNVKAITFTDASGKSWTFQKEQARTFLGLRSQRYTVTGGGGSSSSSSGGLYVNNAQTPLEGSSFYAIGGDGSTGQVDLSASPYVITSNGTALLGGGTAAGSDRFVIQGSGYGHNVGMSQYGANAMAKQGYTYQEILQFYYTGVDISR